MNNKTARKTTQKRPVKKAITKKATTSKTSKKPNLSADNKSSTANAPKLKETPTFEKKATPEAFSFSDVESLIAKRKATGKTELAKKSTAKKSLPRKKTTVENENVVKKRVLGAASLADILGFNPAEKKNGTSIEEESIPNKWKKYYKLLLELREHFTEELDLHTSDTLQHHSQDEIGDRKLEDDAGSDAFDRDFALSLVSSEQETLNEIEDAIQRIKNGDYGICEVTGKPIDKERLTAVPFTRYSVEGQIEFEKNNRRKIERKMDGLFTDSVEKPKITSDDYEDDDN